MSRIATIAVLALASFAATAAAQSTSPARERPAPVFSRPSPGIDPNTFIVGHPASPRWSNPSAPSGAAPAPQAALAWARSAFDAYAKARRGEAAAFAGMLADDAVMQLALSADGERVDVKGRHAVVRLVERISSGERRRIDSPRFYPTLDPNVFFVQYDLKEADAPSRTIRPLLIVYLAGGKVTQLREPSPAAAAAAPPL